MNVAMRPKVPGVQRLVTSLSNCCRDSRAGCARTFWQREERPRAIAIRQDKSGENKSESDSVRDTLGTRWPHRASRRSGGHPGLLLTRTLRHCRRYTRRCTYIRSPTFDVLEPPRKKKQNLSRDCSARLKRNVNPPISLCTRLTLPSSEPIMLHPGSIMGHMAVAASPIFGIPEAPSSPGGLKFDRT